MRNRRAITGAITACAALVVLGGCGGSDHDGHSGAAGTSTSTGASTGASSVSSTSTDGGSHSSGGGSHSTGDDSAEASRTVEVEMRDIAFEPATLTVKAGETVRFVFRNVGEAVHDAFIGDEAAQAHHEKEMRENEGMMHHGDGHGVTVKPGETASLTYTFKEGESVLIGCHQPGHYVVGMKLTLTVT